jgi:hypothetical protein
LPLKKLTNLDNPAALEPAGIGDAIGDGYAVHIY